MSLDVMLNIAESIRTMSRQAIFVRRDGATVEISREEWNASHTDEPMMVEIGERETTEVYTANITHNLNKMAELAGIYQELWRPDECGITIAEQLVEPLSSGLMRLVLDPDKFKALNPTNNWGSYDGLLMFVARYLEACRAYPHAKVTVSR